MMLRMQSFCKLIYFEGKENLWIDVQLKYLDVTVQEKLRSEWSGPIVKVEGCCA
jgi:hypothetical protein